MRVMFWMISSGDGILGGHQRQVKETARRLEALGVSTVIAMEKEPSLEGIDVVHSFGLEPERMRRCRDRGIPVVTSPIYWERSYAFGLRSNLTGMALLKYKARMALVLARSALKGEFPQKCEAAVKRQIDLRVIYEMSDLLLPNSRMEADAITRELGVSTPQHVAPNAVDPEAFTLPAPGTKRDEVLFVGRMEPHKNQIGLIMAMRRSKIAVRITGFAHPHHEKYMRQCQQAAAGCGNITIEPPPADGTLAQMYQRAKVHVLPSWFETTGLVSLEAALCGCNIVTTDRGYARDFFGDLAWYCDPSRPHTIREAIEKAMEAPYRSAMREKILNRYTWEHTAAETLAGYEMVLGMRKAEREERMAAAQ